jgi:predicted amidohydrolase
MKRRSRKLRIATCQFAVGPDIRRNSYRIQRQVEAAKDQRADVVHFSECALSGYAGAEFQSWKNYDWATLADETEKIMALARRRRIWIILGSSHPLTGRNLPHNSLYAIDPKGQIVERYDKRFCTTGDLEYFSPGNHFPVIEIKGVRCGMLICHDVRYPELYRTYRRLEVDCLFNSFHNARQKGPTVHNVIMPATLQARAATNFTWISAPNSSAYYSLWPSVLIQPDGIIAGSLIRNRAGIMVNTAKIGCAFYDASAAFRRDAMAGKLHSGSLVRDPRSRGRTIH